YPAAGRRDRPFVLQEALIHIGRSGNIGATKRLPSDRREPLLLAMSGSTVSVPMGLDLRAAFPSKPHPATVGRV
ncbi:MAG: hypothetical protein ACYCRE_09350, partial [Acidobacteriaceae bacterium]